MRNDHTFATLVGEGMPFGSSVSCTGHDGHGNYVVLADMKIDLRGTGFHLDQSVRQHKFEQTIQKCIAIL